MKRAKILGAVLFLVGGACAEAEDPEIAPIGEPAAPIAVPVPSALPAPLHGGTVLMAGQRPIEVVTHQAGTINAYHLANAPAAPQDAQVTVRVPDAEGVTRPVLLTWDPSEVRYTGVLGGAQPVPGPLELVYVLGDETARVAAPTFVLIKPVVQAALAGTPGAVAPVLVDGPSAPGVVVQAPPPPQIIVHAPSAPPPPQVVVMAPPPPPPPRIVVAPPPPRVVMRPPQPPPRVIVRGPAPPQPHVVVRPSGPPPRVGVRPPPPRRSPVGVGRPPPPRRSPVGVGRPPPPGAGRPGYGPMGPGRPR